jgi:putative phosphotransacetylase
MKVMVETSAHHVHVTKETLEALFGKGATLTNKKNLSQPGQFACVEKVTVVGPKSEMKMSILGPERSADQVEISLTDARKLGIAAPVRESGDIAGTPGCKLVGPEGEVEIECGVIAAKRHIHLDPKTAEEFGLKDKQLVSVKVGENTGRATTFGDVVIRVNANYAPAMHIDTDESNAAGLGGTVDGEIRFKPNHIFGTAFKGCPFCFAKIRSVGTKAEMSVQKICQIIYFIHRKLPEINQQYMV